MIESLYIENYIVIDTLKIDLSKKLNVITGETGAGKSVIIGCLSLLTGQRADLSVLKDKTKKCIVEAYIKISQSEFLSFFYDNDLDYSEQTIIRREINTNGRSRAFINDTPVNLAQLKSLGECLINVHSQHQTINLQKSDYQISVIDDFAQLSEIKKAYFAVFCNYKKQKQQMQELIEKEKEDKKNIDYWLFLLEELQKAELSEVNLLELENEQRILENAETIQTKSSEIVEKATAEELGLLTLCEDVSRLFFDLAGLMPSIEPLKNRFESAEIEIDDIIKEIQAITNDVQSNPAELNHINENLNLLYNLQQKHQVNSIQELIDIQQDLENKVAAHNSVESLIKDLNTQIKATEKELETLSGKLTKQRQKAGERFSEHIKPVLFSLGMPHAQLIIEVKKAPKYLETGLDEIRFLFTANKGMQPEAIGKVASGGELSRLMLAIKSLNTHKQLMPVMVFDEIDTGVSGDIANKVGQILQTIAQKTQLIAITHLPQIAAKGSVHFKVKKIEKKNNTISDIELLNRKARIQELALMLSGSKITAASIKNAEQLLSETKTD